MENTVILDGQVKVIYQYIDKFENIIEEKTEYEFPSNINHRREEYLAKCNYGNVVAVNVKIYGL